MTGTAAHRPQTADARTEREGPPDPVLDAFEAILWSDLVGAEYNGASYVIFWIGLN